MPTISQAQATQYAADAGFTGNSLKIIVAIAHAESGLNTTTISPPNNDQWGSRDKGLVQINDHWHPEVSEACAFSGACAMKQAWNISSHGTNFHPWSTYENGAYKKFMGGTTTVSTTPTAFTTPTAATFNPGKSGQWYDYSFGLLFGQGDAGIGGEHGTDFNTPLDTTVTVGPGLAGTITDISSPSWGKQVTWKLDKPWKGIPYAYQIHLDAIAPGLKVGSKVYDGTTIGWSGGATGPGQVGAAKNPTGSHFFDSPSMSGGPHTEFGFTYGPTYGSGAGFADIHAHPELNPIAYLNAVRARQIKYSPMAGGNPSTPASQDTTTANAPSATAQLSVFNSAPVVIDKTNNAYLALGDAAHQTLAHTPGFDGAIRALDEAEQFPGIYNAFSIPGAPSTTNNIDVPFTGTSVQVPDVGVIMTDITMSVMGTIVNNLMPLAIRAMLVILGAVLVLACMYRLLEPHIDASKMASTAGDASQTAMTAMPAVSKAAPLAADAGAGIGFQAAEAAVLL